MKPKLIFIYSVFFVYLVSIGLTHINPNFIVLSLILMGFIFGFMVNESFFNTGDSKNSDLWVRPRTKSPTTEANTLSNDLPNRWVPKRPPRPPSLSKKEEEMNEKETIRVSFTFDIDVESELNEELEFLHAKAKHSRIKRLVEDYIREKIKDPVSNPDFLKDMKVNFSIHSRTREQIINSMCFTYRHDYGLLLKESKGLSSGMTEEERATLWKKMSHIFDSDIAPYVDLKFFGKVLIIKEPTVELM